MLKTRSKDELWEEFYSGNDTVYNDLLMAYYPLVETTARSLKSTLPQHVEIDDLMSDGFIGLMEAVKSYTPQGYKFETYASLRVRGEIIDKLRISDWAPRSLRVKFREIEKATDFLVTTNQSSPTSQEIADLLGWKVEEVQRVQSDSSQTTFLNIDEYLTVDGTTLSLSEVIADLDVPIDDLDYEPLKERLSSAIEILSDQDRAILALFYVEGIPLSDIGDLLGVTESRACQMQTRALSSLRQLCVPS